MVKHFLEEKDIFVNLPTAFGNTPATTSEFEHALLKCYKSLPLSLSWSNSYKQTIHDGVSRLARSHDSHVTWAWFTMQLHSFLAGVTGNLAPPCNFS